MILHTVVKLKTLGLAKQVVTGAFINGALIGGAVAMAALLASQTRCRKANTAPQQEE